MPNEHEDIVENKDLNKEIIFNSPFYKKRNARANKFKSLSRILSKEEIEKYSKDIWREAHSGPIPAII